MKRLTKTEAAQYLSEKLRGVGAKAFTLRALSKWMRDRGLPHFKIGREVRFDPAQLDRWINRNLTRNQSTR